MLLHPVIYYGTLCYVPLLIFFCSNFYHITISSPFIFVINLSFRFIVGTHDYGIHHCKLVEEGDGLKVNHILRF